MPLLRLAAKVLTIPQAKKHAANDNQVDMLTEYIKSCVILLACFFMPNLFGHRFETGSIQSHKDGSRCWVKDVDPVVESYIGFIGPSIRSRGQVRS